MAFIFNHTSNTQYTPASSSGTDHYDELKKALVDHASNDDVFTVDSIQADAGSNTLSISKDIKVFCKDSQLTKSDDSDYLCSISASGTVEIEGMIFDGGLGEDTDGWSDDNKILNVTNTVDKIVLRNVKIQNGVHVGVDVYGALIEADEAHLHNVHFASAGKYSLRFGGKYLSVQDSIFETFEDSATGYQHRHITTTNDTTFENQILKFSHCIFRSDIGASESIVGNFDNDNGATYRDSHLVEFVSCVFDWLSSTEVHNLIKQERVKNFVVKDCIHIGDSLDDYAIFLNASGSNSNVLVDNCVSPGMFYIPYTLGKLTVLNSRFGLQSDGTTKSVNVGITTNAGMHRVNRVVLENVEFYGLTDKAFTSTDPDDDDQRIVYKNLKLEWDTSNTEYVHSKIKSTHHFVGEGLDVSNIGSGDVRLSNSVEERLMMSHNGDPKVLKYGIMIHKNPDNNTSTGFSTSSTTGNQHPKPGTGTNKFPGVSGFLGDVIEHCDPNNFSTLRHNEQGWIYDGTEWIERS